MCLNTDYGGYGYFFARLLWTVFTGGEVVPDGLYGSREDSVMPMTQAETFSRVDLYASGGHSVTNTTENTQPMTSVINMTFATMTRVTPTTEKYSLLFHLQI